MDERVLKPVRFKAVENGALSSYVCAYNSDVSKLQHSLATNKPPVDIKSGYSDEFTKVMLKFFTEVSQVIIDYNVEWRNKYGEIWQNFRGLTIVKIDEYYYIDLHTTTRVLLSYDELCKMYVDIIGMFSRLDETCQPLIV